jgi:hypothetical protein
LEADSAAGTGGFGGARASGGFGGVDGDFAGGAGPVGPLGGAAGMAGATPSGGASGVAGSPCAADSDCGSGLACTSELGCGTLCSIGDTKFETQTEVDALAARKCVVIDGTVHFYGSSIVSLAGLETVRVVRGGVVLEATSLSNVDGLVGLHEAHAVSISQNPTLNDLGGFANLTRIVSVDVPALIINGNPALVDLRGFSGVQEFDGQLVIAFNDHLESTSPLSVRAAQAVVISSNPELTSLTALESLETLGDISITGNPKLQEIHLEFLTKARSILIAANDAVTWVSLINLKSVDANFMLIDHRALRVAEAMVLSSVGDKLTISGNDVLETMDLPYLSSVGSLEISGNPLFAQCAVDQLAARLNACQSGCTGNDDTATCP